MAKILIDKDDYTGRKQYFDYDDHDHDKEIKLTTEYDPAYATAVMDANRDRRSMGREYYAKDNEMWHVGTIPASVVAEWLAMGVDAHNQDHMPRIIKLLNSSDYQHLKTANIKV